MEALKMVWEAGIDPYLNITVGHYNAKSEDLRMLFRLPKKNKYRTLINVACPSGMLINSMMKYVMKKIEFILKN